MDSEKKTYTLEIEGERGTITVENLTMNGTNYVSETKVDTAAWPPTFKLTAKDEEGTVTEQYECARLIQQEQYSWDKNRWYLAFTPVSAQEIENARLQSQLDYLALMADIDLDA